MTPIEELIDIMLRPDGVPSPALVERLRADYPFFTMPAALLLARGGSMLAREEAERLRAFVALNSQDPSMLYRLTGEHGREFADFYGEASAPPPRPGTNDAIDTFLDRYGTPEDPQETAMLERLIFHPVADYASQLAAQDDAPPAPSDDSPESLSNMLADIQGVAEEEEEKPQPETRPAHTIMPADTTFRESLAKIYVRQHKYDKALEIITALSAKYPEKSCYFADQLRFLRKLMITQQ